MNLAGIMENGTFYASQSGTPQGGVISPLLANIALHGLEDATKQALLPELMAYQRDFHDKTNREKKIFSLTSKQL